VSDQRTPTYPLDEIQACILAGRKRVTQIAREQGNRIRFDEPMILECVLGLTPQDFHKTMPSRRFPGTWQDVYRPTFESEKLYVKVQLDPVRGAVVISFKRR
jgi:motility quorum-sensing regulator/GCU-specific mRNA interferase toxin